MPKLATGRLASQYRDIIRHSAVYGVGQILTRLASVVLLPLYTHYLRPADYGVIAILDLTSGVMGIVVGAGMVAAANRYHFDATDAQGESTVWWTALLTVAAIATIIAGPAFLFRPFISYATLGPEILDGAWFWALVLPTLWFNTTSQVPDQYLRVRKWSGLSVALSLASLLLNIGLNVYFLTVAQLGVSGVLLGNLLTNIALCVTRSGIMLVHCGRARFSAPLALQLARFGSPMIITALLSMVMHQADLFILRIFYGLDQVGLYSLAYTIGQGLNTVFLTPFASIWGVVIYDIAKTSDAKRTYARTFEYYVYALLLMVLAVSLFVKPLLGYVVDARYLGVSTLLPVISLAFVFFSLHEHFKVPALLAKQTTTLIISPTVASAANIALNFMVVPFFGAMGAAWASVATYAIFSGLGLVYYRRIDRIDYPLARCALVLLGMMSTYAVWRMLDLQLPLVWSLLVPAIVWACWAMALFRPLVRHVFPSGLFAAAA